MVDQTRVQDESLVRPIAAEPHPRNRKREQDRLMQFIGTPTEGQVLFDAPLGFEARSIVLFARSSTANDVGLYIPDLQIYLDVSNNGPQFVSTVIHCPFTISRARMVAQSPVTPAGTVIGVPWTGAEGLSLTAFYLERFLPPHA